MRLQMDDIQNRKRLYEQNIRQSQMNQKHLENEVRKLQQDRQSIISATDDHAKTAKYGANYPQLLQRITQSRHRFEGPVLGPIGVHIQLREGCDHLSFALERTFVGILSSFIVTNLADQDVLQQLITQVFPHRGAGPKIIIQIPEPRYDKEIRMTHLMTALKAVDIEDDLVFNCIVNLTRPESVLLIQDEDDMKRQAIERDLNGYLTFRDGITRAISYQGVLYTYRYGNQSAEEATGGNRKLLSRNEGDVIGHYDDQIQIKSKELQAIVSIIKQEQQQYQELHSQYQQFELEIRKINEQNRRLFKTKSDLQNQLLEVKENSNIDTSILETEEKQLQMDNENLSQKIRDISAILDEINHELKQRKEEKLGIDRQKEKITQELTEQEDILRKFIQKSTDGRNKLRRNQMELEKIITKMEEKQLVVNDIEKEYQSLYEKASEETKRLLSDSDGSPIGLESSETIKDLDRKIKTLENDIKLQKRDFLQRMKNHSLESLTEEYQRSKDDLMKTENTFQLFENRVEELTKDYEIRSKKWVTQRNQSSRKVNHYFDMNLQGKKQSGGIQFNHKEGTLNLIVQIDNSNDKTKSRDIRQISGGERSYVALSFLLALGCVVRLTIL